MTARKRIITIGGLPGSGKSSTATAVARELGYDHYSSGDLFRKMAAERGVSLEELNTVAEKQKEIDEYVDEFLRTLGKEKQDFVIDSRTAFHWMPDSFKVFLRLDPAVAAERMFKQIKTGGRHGQVATSVEEMLHNTVARVLSEKKRFHDLYDIDFTDIHNYDLAVDTGAHDISGVAAIIIEAYHKWLANQES